MYTYKLKKIMTTVHVFTQLNHLESNISLDTFVVFRFGYSYDSWPGNRTARPEPTRENRPEPRPCPGMNEHPISAVTDSIPPSEGAFEIYNFRWAPASIHMF